MGLYNRKYYVKHFTLYNGFAEYRDFLHPFVEYMNLEAFENEYDKALNKLKNFKF